jgi:hypothetical protein
LIGLLDDPQYHALSEGTVRGDTIIFTVATVHTKFTGTVPGDEIKLTRDRGDEQTLQFIAKRSR